MNLRTFLADQRQNIRPYLLITLAFNVLAIAFLLASIAIVARDLLRSGTWYERFWAAAEATGGLAGGMALLCVVWLIWSRARAGGARNDGAL